MKAEGRLTGVHQASAGLMNGKECVKQDRRRDEKMCDGLMESAFVGLCAA